MQERPGGIEPTQDRDWLDSRGLGSGRTRVYAFGLSVAAHVVALLLYSSVMDVLRPDLVTLPMPSDAESEQGLEVLRLLELAPADDPEEPDDPAQIDAVAADPVETGVPESVAPPVGELVPPGPSGAERLRPILRDRRLWAQLPDEFYELTIEEQEELIVSARIVEWYDSLAIAQGLEDRLTDWTVRDGEGGRWGVADGKIYLGDIALPLPFNFGMPVGRRDEANRRLFEFEEIERQSQRYLIETTWKERAAATRARRDRERAAAARDTIRYQ